LNPQRGVAVLPNNIYARYEEIVKAKKRIEQSEKRIKHRRSHALPFRFFLLPSETQMP